MSGALTLPQWVDCVSRFYLDDFIRGGGSAVKFIVCYDVEPQEAAREVAEAAYSRGFLTADVDSGKTRIHQIEQVFGRIADQLPWSELTDGVLRKLAVDQGWLVPDRFDDRGVDQQLNELNSLDVGLINMGLQRSISNMIFSNRDFAKDYRVAMTWLARARIKGGPRVGADFQNISDWLGARVSRISSMRDYMIFNKVSRANARYLLASLLAWVRLSGRPGVVVNLDASRLLQANMSRDGSISYSKAALLDAYEVFRQFVDSTDELEGLLLNVFVPPSFLDLETRGRGMGRYPALMYRVYDEVRDRHLANPLTALVRLNSTGQVA